MEGQRSSNNHQRDAMSTPTSGIVIQEPSATAGIPNDGGNENPQQIFRQNSDVYVSNANVTRIMRSILPANSRISDDAKETVQQYVTEFISFITNEANEKCRRESRRTIQAEDIISAMETLGFDNYVEPLTLFLNRYRDQNPDRHAMRQVSFSRHNVGSSHQRPTPQTVGNPLPPSNEMNNQGGGESSSAGL